MARTNHPIVSLNGGEIGGEVMARTSLETYGATGSIVENFLPDAAGPFRFRSGLRYRATLLASAGLTHGIPFVYDDQTYGVLLSANAIRIEQSGGIIVRPAVSAVISGGTFPSGLSGWTNISAGGGSATGGSTGLVLDSNGTDTAGVRQAVTANPVGTTHAFRIVVARGPVTLRIGSTAGGDEYQTATQLKAGTHSIGVVPTSATIHVEISSTEDAQRIVTSIALEAAGDLVLTTPWSESQIRGLRHESSNDVIFFTSGAGIGKRLERRSAIAWSLVDSEEHDGPFLSPNVDSAYTLTPSVRSGNGTLTASRALFKAGHVGSIWKVVHSGQFVTRIISGADQFTDFIKVQGTGTSRRFSIDISGTFSATITLQRSIGNTTSWTDYANYTTSTTLTDGLNNQTVYYKIGVKSGGYTSGSPVVSLDYQGGSTEGVCRITGFTSATVVSMEVIETFGNVTAAVEWYQGAWSDVQNWPKAVALYDGRLWKGGLSDRFWGSVSDAFESFASGDEDDSSIARNIAVGTAKRILSFLPLARLIVLTGESAADYQPATVTGGEVVIKSSAFDEPLTPSNLTVRDTLASRGIFIDRAANQAMEMFYSVESQDYQTRSLMRLHKDLGRPGLRQIFVAKKPEMRLGFVRSDGQVLIKLFDPADNVLGWARIITDGVIESAYVKPATDEDEIMMIVRRTVNGASVLYLEQLDPIYLASAVSANRVDSYVRRDDSAGFTTLSGLSHLEGRTVKVWANGASHPDCVVTGGAITLNRSVTSAVAGLAYTGRFKSSKLALAAQAGTALAQQGRVERVSFIVHNSTLAIEYGADFDTMDWVRDRSLEDHYDAGPGLVSTTTEPMPVPGNTSRDSRFCLRVSSPHPVNIAGMVLAFALNERV